MASVFLLGTARDVTKIRRVDEQRAIGNVNAARDEDGIMSRVCVCVFLSVYLYTLEHSHCVVYICVCVFVCNI